MHTEHLTNLHPGWVVGGWALAAVVTGGTYMALVGVGVAPTGDATVWGLALAMAVGFFAGGFLVGMRWCDAPIIHGGAITFFSVLVWFGGSVALPGSMQALEGSTRAALGLILLQFVASVGGGWTGRTFALGGEFPGSDAA